MCLRSWQEQRGAELQAPLHEQLLVEGKWTCKNPRVPTFSSPALAATVTAGTGDT